MSQKSRYVKHNPDLPETGQAVHVGLLVLTKTGCNTWKTLVESPETWERVTLTDEQQALIDRHDYMLQHLQIAPLRTIDICDTCNRWVLTTRKPGKNCTLSVGCEGKLHHVPKSPYREKRNTR